MDLIKGTLDVLILRTLAEGAQHGYAISQAILSTSGELLRVEEGALYPALRRLEKRGWLAAEWGTTSTGREARFYELTPAGRRQLSAAIAHWDRYVDAMGRVLQGSGGER